jgi:hypothetical protein
VVALDEERQPIAFPQCRPEHDGDLRKPVTSRQELPDARHSAHSSTVASIAAMPFWLALAVAIVLTIASLIYVTLNALEAFRAFKRVGPNVTAALDRVTATTAQIERHLELAAESGSQLEASLARLRTSRAELNVLTSALADVRASVNRVTAFMPRK